MFEDGLTITKAMEGTNLNTLSKLIEKINVVKAVAYFALRLSENFNVGKKLTDDQASIMAFDLLDIFKYETIEDVLLMFKYARQGKIGDGKDFKLDSQTVFHKWVPQYLELKAIERENNHNKSKGESSINNYNWDKDSITKFEVDGNIQLPKSNNGLGTRKRKELSVPEGFYTPEMNRASYLKALAEHAKNASIEDLKFFIESREGREHEQDMVKVAQDEINSRS